MQSIEIGGAHEDELDTVLQVMCAAFELPFDVARPIYYADPWFDRENKRVLRVNGKIVSCLTLVPQQWRLGRATLDVFGIAGVATLPAYQRQGYGGRLLLGTLDDLYARETPCTGLFASERRYYARFGWETVSTVTRCMVAPHALATFSARVFVRPALPEDLPALQNMYDAYCNTLCSQGMMRLLARRDALRWKYLFDRVPEFFVVTDREGDLEGYLIGEILPGETAVAPNAISTSRSPRFRIHEMYAASASARRGLIGFLATQTSFDRIVYEGVAGDFVHSALIRGNAISDTETETRGSVASSVNLELFAGLMLRVVHFPRLIHDLAANWNGFCGRLTLICKEKVAATLQEIEEPQAVHLSSVNASMGRRTDNSATSVVVVTGDGRGRPDISVMMSEFATGDETTSVLDLPALAEGNWVEGDTRAWSSVAMGHISGDDACALGMLQAPNQSAAMACGALFPAWDCYLSSPDHF